ncbi:hypothetical protein L838_1837 [Mycobacterium avium MAV_120709_2344]|nr:hypothetical protein L838_1837 [Mycobacterium avium MAV_120709_2344]
MKVCRYLLDFLLAPGRAGRPAIVIQLVAENATAIHRQPPAIQY